jgi:hypothetical protein
MKFLISIQNGGVFHFILKQSKFLKCRSLNVLTSMESNDGDNILLNLTTEQPYSVAIIKKTKSRVSRARVLVNLLCVLCL